MAFHDAGGIDGRVHAAHRLVGVAVGLGDDPFEQRQQHRVLGGEVEVEGRSGDAGALGQVVDGDLGERALLEQALGGGQNGQLTVVSRGPGGASGTGAAGLADGGHKQ